MSLKDFQASGGDVEFLKHARRRAMAALVQGHSLDVKLSAAIIAVSAGYVHVCKVSSRDARATSKKWSETRLGT